MPPEVDHFVVIGAGASFGARDEEPPPPLGDGLAQYLADWYAANEPTPERMLLMDWPEHFHQPSRDIYWPARVREGLERFLRDATKRGFEKAALDFFNEHHNQLTFMGEHLNRLVGFALLTGDRCAFREAPAGDRYDRLLQRLQGKLAFVSLNYDILLEEALIRAGIQWDYVGPRLNGERRPLVGVPVFKPHGSANWLRQISSPVSSNLDLARKLRSQFPDVVPYGPHHSVDSQSEYLQSRATVAEAHRGNTIIHMKLHDNYVPVIAVYAEGKPAEINYSCIEFCQNECVAAIEANPAAAVTVIGARVPETLQDDERFTTIVKRLGDLRGAKNYVGDDPKWQDFGFRHAGDKFEEYVP